MHSAVESWRWMEMLLGFFVGFVSYRGVGAVLVVLATAAATAAPFYA